MIDLVEAKLLGLWAPREGQHTDAMFMTAHAVAYRCEEALRMYQGHILMDFFGIPEVERRASAARWPRHPYREPDVR